MAATCQQSLVPSAEDSRSKSATNNRHNQRTTPPTSRRTRRAPLPTIPRKIRVKSAKSSLSALPSPPPPRLSVRQLSPRGSRPRAQHVHNGTTFVETWREENERRKREHAKVRREGRGRERRRKIVKRGEADHKLSSGNNEKRNPPSLSAWRHHGRKAKYLQWPVAKLESNRFEMTFHLHKR